MDDYLSIALKARIERLEAVYFEQFKNIRQDDNYAYDAGLCEGQIRAIQMCRKIIKEVFNDT